MRGFNIALTGLTTVALLSAPAGATVMTYAANITALNESGVTGRATFVHDTSDNTLAVRVRASGLEANQPHVQHIHGLFDDAGNPIDSKTPTLANDLDNDNFIELLEGAAAYGPIIVPLSSPPGGALADFPTAPNGRINFFEIYHLDDPATFDGEFTADDLFPLELREIVLHGMTVPPGLGAGTPGEVDGTGGYLATLPVASGEISAVPLPAAGLLLLGALGGLGGLGGFVARRRQAAA